MTRAAARFGWAALLAAWVVDQFFWQKTPGLSFPLWVALVLVTGLVLARSVKVRPSPASLALLALALVFAVMTFLRREDFTVFISSLLAFFTLALLAATFQTGNWIYYRILDYARAGLWLFVALLVRAAELFVRKPQAAPAAAPADSMAAAAPAEGESAPGGGAPVLVAAAVPGWKAAGQQALPIARGLLLALPIVLVLGALLASADPIFNQWVASLTAIFDLSKLGEYLFRLIYILILAYALAGTYLHAIQPSLPEARPDPEARWFRPFLGWTEAVVVLAAVNLLFLVFVLIQSWYLFGGQANINTTGFTYAEYARRGFNELVIVALLSLLLYVSLGACVNQDARRQRLVLTVLNVALIAQVLVILVSSLSRLLLYEDAYGFTQLRTYTHIFIVWLGILLLVTIALEITRRRARFALAGLLVTFGFGLTLGVINVDGFIAQQNIQRAWASGKFDGQYLTSLSDDAVPVMLAEFTRPNQPANIKDHLGAELACREVQVNAEPQAASWLSTNLSHNAAVNLLRTNHALWAAYVVRDTGRGIPVNLPSGGTHTCLANQPID